MKLPRRLWHVHVDERSREVGWTIGSKVYRSRLESGKLDGLHYDLAVPYNEGRPMVGWRAGLPQFYKGVPYDGRLLRIDTPDGQEIFLEFMYEVSGVPGSLLCELIANFAEIPAEEMRDAQSNQPHQADVAKYADPARRPRNSREHLRREEGVGR